MNNAASSFLDLTHGAEDDADGVEPYDDDEDEEDDGGALTTDASSSPLRARAVSAADPSTPGKVVEAGREHTGRWTKEEHEAFLAALQMYGKEWKKVAAKVKTRTVVQTRTHAQKYFQKLQKTMEQTGLEDLTEVEMGISSTAKQKKTDSKRKARPVANRRSSSTTISAAQVISGMSHNSAFAAPAKHGFGSDDFATPASESNSPSSSGGWLRNLGVKIVAPDPSMPRGFPEPSPAATGKRKLAEIAAARMLAGVAGDDGPPTPPPTEETRLNLKEAPLPPLLGAVGDASVAKAPERKGLTLQILNPDSLGINYQEEKRRRRGGESSPVTPWDGQLEQLMNEKAFGIATSDGASSSNGYATMKEPGAPLAVCGPPTGYDRGLLHAKVCEMDPEGLQSAIERDAQTINQRDALGYAPLHTACALYLTTCDGNVPSAKIVDLLLANGADAGLTDSKGNTPLHWAARSGDKDVAVKLLLKNCQFDARNSRGETPLHWAMRSGGRGMDVATILLENGARPNIYSKDQRRPIDVAAEGFLDDPNSLVSIKKRDELGQKVKKELKKTLKETAADRRDSRANLLIRSATSRSLVLHHPECLEHHPKSLTDWEAPDRITSIMRRVLPSSDSTGATETSGIFPYEVTVSQEFERAKLDMLSRVHSAEYLSFVNELSKDLERQLKESGGAPVDESSFGSPPPVVPFTPLVQRSMIKVDDASVKQGINSDTSFSAGSLKAARRAAGALQHAVDCVLVGRNRNAFCVVRPPGHHAGINGLLEGGESCGFCIFNNVAAGALYAISEDRLLCNRCAIVDIDVHHGNGTEEIVRKCNDPSKLFFFSIHLYDNDKKKRTGNQYAYKFYPGTGDEDDLAMNIINVPIVPLWKEGAIIAPVSNRTHNTRQKKTRSSQDSQDDSSETGSARETTRTSDAGSEAGSTSATASSPRHPATVSSGRMAYRQAIQSRLLPSLRAFNPDLILISAGFDASKGDVGNARHERGRERMGLDLEPEDYAWTTRKILEIADICCQGRVVSVLEGGYGRTPAAPQVVPGQPESLDRTMFAECAIRHLQAMIDPYDIEQRFSC